MDAEKGLKTVRELLIILHGFLVITNFIMYSDKIRADGFKYTSTFAGMMFYQYIILSVAQLIFVLPRPELCRNIATASTVLWLRIELVVWFAIIISNVTYLFLRSQIKVYLEVDNFIEETLKLPQIDYLIATRPIGFSFHTEMVPFLISNFLYFGSKHQVVTMTGILDKQLEVILFSNYISVICTITLIFIPWKQGPKKWVKYAPYLFFFMMITVFTIIPIANMVFAVALWAIPQIPNKSSVYESWVLFYFIVNISRVVSFFT
jgi:hypothetical protein